MIYSLFFILYSLFFILYSLFFILYSLFFILYLLFLYYCYCHCHCRYCFYFGSPFNLKLTVIVNIAFKKYEEVGEQQMWDILDLSLITNEDTIFKCVMIPAKGGYFIYLINNNKN